MYSVFLCTSKSIVFLSLSMCVGVIVFYTYAASPGDRIQLSYKRGDVLLSSPTTSKGSVRVVILAQDKFQCPNKESDTDGKEAPVDHV